jgi:hypothetical protein
MKLLTAIISVYALINRICLDVPEPVVLASSCTSISLINISYLSDKLTVFVTEGLKRLKGYSVTRVERNCLQAKFKFTQEGTPEYGMPIEVWDSIFTRVVNVFHHTLGYW